MHLALSNFGGMMPRFGEQNIPDNMATLAQNTLLLSGELRGIFDPIPVANFDVGYTVRMAYHVVDDTYDFWVPFDCPCAHFLKGPLVNDTYDRYYWVKQTAYPEYSTLSDLYLGNTPKKLGVPEPAAAPTLTPPSTTSSSITVTRAYVFTYVTAYGEEGPPSPPAVGSGPDSGTWAVGNLNVALANSDYSVSKIRIYRTVTGQSGATDYHFVTELTMPQTSYNDTSDTDEVALNDLLQSFSWYPPPDGWVSGTTYDYDNALQGIIAHPNGFLVGYVGRDLYFSEPYRPHAWPPDYVVSTQDDIVGLGVYGTTIVVATKSHPYSAVGIHPASITLVKHSTPEPCLAHWSIVSFPFGVVYASENGLVMVNSSGTQVVTSSVITRNEWEAYVPSNIMAARFNNQYIGFYADHQGFMFSPEESQASFVELLVTEDVEAVQTDHYTGAVVVIRDNSVQEWNPTGGVVTEYKWESKEFTTPKPVNFGAFKCEWYGQQVVGDTAIEEAEAFNTARYVYPLNPLNHVPLNGSEVFYDPATSTHVTKYDIPIVGYPRKLPVADSVLYNIEELTTLSSWLRVIILADDDVVFDEYIEDTKLYRIPAGFKATRWKIKLWGTSNVKNFKMAETSNGLAAI